MVVLRRIRASTLMETLVATVLIVIIFMVSSMLLNNLFSASMKGRDDHVLERLYRLKYEYRLNNLVLPYYEEMGDWDIHITKDDEEGKAVILFKAESQRTDRSIIQKGIDGH